jgi:hypothetical protein
MDWSIVVNKQVKHSYRRLFDDEISIASRVCFLSPEIPPAPPQRFGGTRVLKVPRLSGGFRGIETQVKARLIESLSLKLTPIGFEETQQ